MFFEICMILALGILAVFLKQAIGQSHTTSRCISMILLGICVSSVIMFLPVYWAESAGYAFRPFRMIVFSLYYGFKAIGGSQEIKLLENFQAASAVFRFTFILLNYIYFVAAPLLTSSLILSFIGDALDRIRYRYSWRRNYHIFSELNETTLHIARRIRKRDSGSAIVFCRTKDVSRTMLAQSKAMGAVNLHVSCELLRIPSANRNMQFYLFSADEDDNLNLTEQLICAHREKEDRKILINAFAESGTGIQVVESMEKGSVGVRFTDSTALLCNNLLMKYPLYDLPEGCKTISVVIVGCDKTGMRMLKTVAWCGQVDGCRLKIRIYDKNAECIDQKLMAQCPELRKSCDIAFITADAETAAFETALLDPEYGSADATYVVVATGDDERNIAVAERLYRIYRHGNHYRWTPRILVRIRSASKTAVYGQQNNDFLAERRICLFGGMEELFSSGAMLHSYLERMALAVNLCYSDLLPDKDADTMTDAELNRFFATDAVKASCRQFLHSEYSRRSSMASALHISVKLHSCGLLQEGNRIPTDETAKKFREALRDDPQLLERLAKNEHLRWNSFIRSEGYCAASWEDLQAFYPILKKKNNQDVLSKRHICLVDWEQLDDMYSKYMSLQPPFKPDFKYSDRNIVKNIPKILLFANRLEQIRDNEFLLF